MTAPFQVGQLYRFGENLCGLFYRVGWTGREMSIDRIFRCSEIRAGEDPEADFADVLTGRVWIIGDNWWHEVFEGRMTLGERERLRMRSEPWVARRDENLRDMFKPK